jgi:quinol monooxygenase YgiN
MRADPVLGSGRIGRNQKIKSHGEPKMSPKVVVIGILRFPPSEVSNVLPHLKLLVDETKKNDGCTAYDVAEDPFERGLIRFSELWPDHESLQRHLQAPHIQPWRHAAKKCGLIERKFTAFDITGSTVV